MGCVTIESWNSIDILQAHCFQEGRFSWKASKEEISSCRESGFGCMYCHKLQRRLFSDSRQESGGKVGSEPWHNNIWVE